MDNKTLYYDVEGFKFYVLAEQNSKFKSYEELIGFFSKEKLSYDNYNLACIMTLPSHQRKGFGTLLIELSKITNIDKQGSNYNKHTQAMNYQSMKEK